MRAALRANPEISRFRQKSGACAKMQTDLSAKFRDLPLLGKKRQGLT
jgi:hypothetical protein